jgi:hypothetical protein
MKADVFLDELVMAHTIPFRERLTLDSPTISVTDLLLSKLQIHEITENDLMDAIVLLADHALGRQDRESVDESYIVDMMRKDWGFFYTTIANLKKIEVAFGRYDALGRHEAADVLPKVQRLMSEIQAAPKSRRWKLRAKLGTRVRWYEEVEDVHR